MRRQAFFATLQLVCAILAFMLLVEVVFSALPR